MILRFVCIGKKNRSPFLDQTERYIQRIQKYCSFEWHFISPETIPQKLRSAEKEKALRSEQKKIEKVLSPSDTLVVLDEKGKDLDSIGYARFLGARAQEGLSSVTFLCGSAFGLHPNLKKQAQWKIRLSSMTFPHEMVWLFFSEQTYRAFSILNNEPYHK